MSADSIRVMRPLFQAGEGGSIPTSALSLWVEPVDFDTARALNRLWHSKLPRLGTGAVKSGRKRFLCYAAECEGRIYAVAIWSHPAARRLPQRTWLELRRLAIGPEAPRNTASRMLAVMKRLIQRARPLVEKLISYQDCEAHTGSIYAAAGWVRTVRHTNTNWDNPSRPRPKSQTDAPNWRWELSLLNKGMANMGLRKWQEVWRNKIAPLLETRELEALHKALAEDDPARELVPGTPLSEVRQTLIERHELEWRRWATS